ncbi:MULTISPECIES: hypothetical protein [unclassified Nostoc]|uniref:hypothetical protein n=1 Tax=unclassified Nostoc TaxID=2593658 RepID=UPI002AD2E2A5|nr:hypothetical protein [Nostoc sp. ChiQUE02]MDZ8228916.1 hypothetical protein [Nostoc sp. ChiQUE02]
MIKRSAESSASSVGAKPGLSLVGNLGDEVGATKNMGSAVVRHGREGMAFVFRMPIIDVVRCAARQHTLQAKSSFELLNQVLMAKIVMSTGWLVERASQIIDEKHARRLTKR